MPSRAASGAKAERLRWDVALPGAGRNHAWVSAARTCAHVSSPCPGAGGDRLAAAAFTAPVARRSGAQHTRPSVCPHRPPSGPANPVATLARNRTRAHSGAEKADPQASSNLPDSKLVSSRGRRRIHSSCVLFFPFLFVQRPGY